MGILSQRSLLPERLEAKLSDELRQIG